MAILSTQPKMGALAFQLARSSLAIFAFSQAFAQSGTLTLACGPAGSAQVGGTYTNACGLTGGTPPYQWRVNFLPLGLTYKVAATIPVSTLPPTNTPIAIQITGVPAIAGPYAYTVTVTHRSQPSEQTETQIVAGTVAPGSQGPVISGIFGPGSATHQSRKSPLEG